MVQYTIAGNVLTMPVRIRKADVHTAMFSVSAEAAQQLIDYSGLDVCQFRPGRAVVTLMLARYMDGDLGRYNEFDQLRVAGVRAADLKGFQYSRDDVDARSLANQYAQILGQIFTHEMKPLEVEILGEAQMAELGMGSLLGVGQGSVRVSGLDGRAGAVRPPPRAVRARPRAGWSRARRSRRFPRPGHRAFRCAEIRRACRGVDWCRI